MNPPRAELDALFAEYRGALPGKLARLETLLAGGRTAELARDLHTLGGSAGTFGLPKLGEAARAAGAHLAACGTDLDPGQRAELDRLLGVVRHEACTA
jgi:HPt (histidine-containing phosphotransfer) domain-containing protein